MKVCCPLPPLPDVVDGWTSLNRCAQEADATGSEVKVLAQLKLDDAVNNDFEYCEIHVPFPNRYRTLHAPHVLVRTSELSRCCVTFFLRGQITSVQASPTSGSVTLDDRKQTLKWEVGQRFASRNLEVALPASVVFDGVSRPTDIFDPFCTGPSCYVQVPHARTHALESSPTKVAHF
jgi:AP-5 complex subunit mu-1